MKEKIREFIEKNEIDELKDYVEKELESITTYNDFVNFCKRNGGSVTTKNNDVYFSIYDGEYEYYFQASKVRHDLDYLLYVSFLCCKGDEKIASTKQEFYWSYLNWVESVHVPKIYEEVERELTLLRIRSSRETIAQDIENLFYNKFTLAQSDYIKDSAFFVLRKLCHQYKIIKEINYSIFKGNFYVYLSAINKFALIYVESTINYYPRDISFKVIRV